MNRFVLGAGISGLLWAYYHDDYVVITDDFGRLVTGIDPVVWLNDTDLTRRLVKDLGLRVEPVEKPIGYKIGDRVLDRIEVARGDPDFLTSVLDDILLKKMVPWETLEASRGGQFSVRVRTPSRSLTKDSDVLSYLDVDMSDLVVRLVEAVTPRICCGQRIEQIDASKMISESGSWEYEHIVSTIPAPIFARIWRGERGLPRLHWCPVTFVISNRAPGWWDDRFIVVYDHDLDSPVSRVGRFGRDWRWEFTGRPDDDTLADYLPIPNGRFVNPYGRIVQDVRLVSPDPRILFLGRTAEWDYRGLIDRTLERVHGRR